MRYFLTLILLTWRIWWAPNNSIRWQMGFNSAFKGLICGPGSSVGIATELRAGRSGIESQWGRDFPPVKTGRGAHPASCKLGTGFFPAVSAAGACCWQLTPFWCRGHGRVELYLYPPSGPHRACNRDHFTFILPNNLPVSEPPSTISASVWRVTTHIWAVPHR